MPNYTKTERKELAKIYLEAQEDLWNGKGDIPKDKQEHICAAIHYHMRPSGRERMAFEAVGIIMRRLGTWIYVTHWLRMEAGIPKKDLTYPKVQAYRKAWMQELHEEFSK